MSRFEYEDSELPYEFWEHNLILARSGKRGQAALRQMLQTLESMPKHELVRDMLVNPEEGTVCAVGAMLAWQRLARNPGATWDEVLGKLYEDHGEPEGHETADIAVAELGITKTLAWDLAYRNDEMYSAARTPAELWQATYDYVKGLIANAE